MKVYIKSISKSLTETSTVLKELITQNVQEKWQFIIWIKLKISTGSMAMQVLINSQWSVIVITKCNANATQWYTWNIHWIWY